MNAARLSRRTVLSALGGALVGLGPRSALGDEPLHSNQATTGPAQDDSLVARLSNPWAAGRSQQRISDYENDPYIIALEERIKCTCGCAHSIYTCRTTDFSCGFWQEHHQWVIDRVDEGMSADEIVQRYVEQNGTQYLMAPPPRGFNLTGYLVPGVLITLVGGTLVAILHRRSRLMPAVESVTADGLSAEDQARIQEELDKLDL